MDLFKLFYNHDLRLDKLAERNANKHSPQADSSLADFMTPTPTYSKFYLTGTQLPEGIFGLNKLQDYELLSEKLDTAFNEFQVYTSSASFENLSEAMATTPLGEPLLLSKQKIELNLSALRIDRESNVGHHKEELREVLQQGPIVGYKEQAKDGFDLHLFSKQNIYPLLFYPLQKLISSSFRFFSINSKRMRSERHFYFETWSLQRPPHGAEEVFAETTL